MRVLLSASAAVVLGALLLAACNSRDSKGPSAGNASGGPTSQTFSTAQQPGDGVRRVTVVELRDALEKGTAVVVDVRPAVAYKSNHIKGSVNIPAEEAAARIAELPRDKMIVTYCS